MEVELEGAACSGSQCSDILTEQIQTINSIVHVIQEKILLRFHWSTAELIIHLKKITFSHWNYCLHWYLHNLLQCSNTVLVLSTSGENSQLTGSLWPSQTLPGWKLGARDGSADGLSPSISSYWGLFTGSLAAVAVGVISSGSGGASILPFGRTDINCLLAGLPGWSESRLPVCVRKRRMERCSTLRLSAFCCFVLGELVHTRQPGFSLAFPQKDLRGCYLTLAASLIYSDVTITD